MKYLITIFLSILGFNSLKAQFATYQDGSPAKEIKLTNIEGSELLYNDWQKGSVKLASGSIYSDLMLKYNVYEDVLYFLSKDNISMSFTKPVIEFHLGNDTYRNGFPAVKKFNNLSYFKVLEEGKATLLKKISKNIMDVKEFNSSISTKKITDATEYFIVLDGKIYPAKSDKTTLVNLLSDKKEQMTDYSKTTKVNLKDDMGFSAFIKHYNSLN